MHFKANWNGMLTEILNNINKHNEFDINFEKNILRYIYYLLSLFYLLQSFKITDTLVLINEELSFTSANKALQRLVFKSSGKTSEFKKALNPYLLKRNLVNELV